MSNRKLSQKERDSNDEEEREPLFQDTSKWHKPEQHSSFCRKFCVRPVLLGLCLLATFFLLVISSFQLSNMEEILSHPSSIPDYFEHFEHSLNAIGQDSTWFDFIKASRPKTYSNQDKARLDLNNNPNHIVWGVGGVTVTQTPPSCVPVNETYLLIVLNTPSAISANMDSFVTMSTEQNHFIVSRTYDFLPIHPTSLLEKTKKEKTMTAYFTQFKHKTASVSSTPYLNFEQFQLTEPVYIGTVRDPIARLQSQYESKWGGHDSTRLSSKSFLDCVRAFIRNNISAAHLVYGTDSTQLESLGLPYPITRKIVQIANKHTCFSPEYLNVQVQAYCGLDCEQLQKETAEKSLQSAILHMNERFRVVLVAEELHSAVQLLEKVVPEYFTGLNKKASSILKMFSSPPIAVSPLTPAPIGTPTPAPIGTPTPAPIAEVVAVTAPPERLPPRRCPAGSGQFCFCEGTIYYGKAFVNGKKFQLGGEGPMCSLEELKSFPYLSQDVSATGGVICSHTALGRDPLRGFTKQCICDPNKPARRHLRESPLARTNDDKAVKLSSQVQEYLESVLRYEYRLYAAARQHLALNLQQCGLQARGAGV